MSAERFVERLKTYQSPDELEKIQRYFKTGEGEYGEGDEFIGERMGQVFALAKEFIDRSPDRPNPIGLHRVEILSIEGRRFRVRNLEALHATPIVDVKPMLTPTRP
jgi:tRNA-methyltransferase O/DNA alkylation repair enzyme